MIPIRTEWGNGYSPTAPSENYQLLGSLRSWQGKNPPLIYCHGSGGSAASAFDPNLIGERILMTELAQRYMVIAPDLGLEVWGNNTHTQRISEALAYLQTRFGYPTTQKVTLVASSMGNLGALRYALLNPTKVAAVGSIIPALDLADLMTRGASSAINAAYPPGYNDATMGPTYSPVRYASAIDSTIPLHLFTANDDSITVPATAAAFVAARPGTLRTDVGAFGHSQTTIWGAVPPLMNWLLSGV